ncbi:hypothetical protein LTR78_007755 [Recurvomyces mirabilis]|uniref:Uncharacterized protein n=1 Tax=Recurvomyces mirabilis TaxID=574656 RepID=A0AAE0TSQ7_9PEZI|nr:hypothetical protein LTR78_007755 [Recurvomyces mirabilis]KAK5151643.1 hypothetical protein LTS14_009130 [Recurvomyces mirabilis]
MAELSSALSSVSTAFTLSLRITEKVYEVVAVDQEAKDLLKTTSQISCQLEHAKKLRRQKSFCLSTDEKEMVDRVFTSTEEAVATVASLVEPARADMRVTGGRVKFATRMQFVFRDSAHIPVSLTRLSIAGGNLNMAICVLCAKEGSRESRPGNDSKSPPSYQDSEWLHATRHRNLRKRESAASFTTLSDNAPRFSLTIPDGSLVELPEDVLPAVGEADIAQASLSVSATQEELYIPPSPTQHKPSDPTPYEYDDFVVAIARPVVLHAVASCAMPPVGERYYSWLAAQYNVSEVQGGTSGNLPLGSYMIPLQGSNPHRPFVDLAGSYELPSDPVQPPEGREPVEKLFNKGERRGGTENRQQN